MHTDFQISHLMWYDILNYHNIVFSSNPYVIYLIQLNTCTYAPNMYGNFQWNLANQRMTTTCIALLYILKSHYHHTGVTATPIHLIPHTYTVRIPPWTTLKSTFVQKSFANITRSFMDCLLCCCFEAHAVNCTLNTAITIHSKLKLCYHVHVTWLTTWLCYCNHHNWHISRLKWPGLNCQKVK